MENQSYTWTDNPTVSGVSPCDTDILNECLMHLKYNQQQGDGFNLFDIKITDRKLVGTEAAGWVLQGGLVTMTYPDAVNKIIEEFDEGVSTTYREINCIQSLNGHYIADIEQKDAIDQLFSQTGIAEFYILDKTNQQFYLPRNNWFMQMTSDDKKVNIYNEAGLPNHQHSPIYITGSSADLGDPGNLCITNGGQSNGVRTCTNSRTGDVSNNGIYGKSSTVQPQSSNKLVYYKVGNISTSVNQILIDAEEYLKESTEQLENTTEEGLNAIEDAKNESIDAISSVTNTLNQTQISNCILESPKTINYELQDGVFTLKAGSVAVVPYGTEEPGLEIGADINGYEVVDIQYENNKLYYWVKTKEDYSIQPQIASSDVFIMLNAKTSGLIEISTANLISTATPPDPSSGLGWFDEANNIIKEYTSNNVWENSNYLSFPFIQLKLDSTMTSYKDVSFELYSIGYFGKTIFINKGLKVLIPNGLNDDGSLNNIAYTNDKFRLKTIESNTTDKWIISITHPKDPQYSECEILITQDTLFDSYYENPPYQDSLANGEIKYLPVLNLYWEKQENKVDVRYIVPVGNIRTTANYNILSTFTPQKTLSCLTFQSPSFISSMSMPSTYNIALSVGASGTLYTAPADGWFSFIFVFSSSNTYVHASTSSGLIFQEHNSLSGSFSYSLPIAKNQTLYLVYEGKCKSKELRFTYLIGAK